MKNLSWKQKFIALYSGQFVSLVTSSAVQFAIIWWLTVQSDGSAWVLTLAGLAGFLPQAIIGLYAGALVDRYSRKWVMIISDGLIAIATLLLLGAIAMGADSMILALGVLAVRSVATAFHTPAMQASIPMMAPEEHLVQVNGWGQSIAALSNIIGPVLGLSLLSVGSIEWVLGADVVGALLAVSVLAFITIPNPPHAESAPTNLYQEMRQGVVVLWGNPALLRLTFAITVVAMLYIPLGTYFPLMSISGFGKGVVEAGIVEMVFATGLVLGGVLIGIIGERIDKIKTMAMGILLMGVALMVSGLLGDDGFVLFVILSGLVGVSGPLFSAPFYAYVQINVEPEIMGRVFGLITSLALLSTPLGYLLAGVILSYTNVSILFLITGVLIVFNALVVLKAK